MDFVFTCEYECEYCHNIIKRTHIYSIYCKYCDNTEYIEDIFIDVLHDLSDCIESVHEKGLNTIENCIISFKYDDYDTSSCTLKLYDHKSMNMYVIEHELEGDGCPCGICTNYHDIQRTFFIYLDEEKAHKMFKVFKETNYLYENKDLILKSTTSFNY